MENIKYRCRLPALYLLTVASLMTAVLWGSRVVTVMSEHLPIPRSYCFIIDAGHGGEDGGAVSCTGISESSINLDIALRLDDLLHFLGYDTKMTRKTDISIYTKGETLAQKKISDLKERVRIIEDTDHAILLSIHQNNFPDSRYCGAQVFHNGKEPSIRLAQLMQTNLVQSLNPASNRKCKQSSGVYLMEHISCPGVLIECGFLSSPEEETKLRTEEYQKQLACVIACTAVSYANT